MVERIHKVGEKVIITVVKVEKILMEVGVMINQEER